MNCLFCKIIASEIPAYKIYEDEDFLAILDINPLNLGHALLMPKTHCQNLFDLPNEILAKFGLVLKKIATAVKAGTQADGLNIIWNNESAAGQLIFHSHTHIVPRFTNDGYQHWKGPGTATPTDFEKIQQAIKKSLI